MLSAIKLLEDTKKLLEKLPAFENCWIAGGAARDIFLEQDFTADIDIFFKDCETFQKWENHLEEYPVERSTYARTYTLPYQDKTIEVQLVNLGYWDDINQNLADFDWTVCQFAYDAEGLRCSIKAVQDLIKKELHWNKMKTGIGGVRRMIKYVGKGYTLTDETIKEFLRYMAKYPDEIEKEWKNAD